MKQNSLLCLTLLSMLISLSVSCSPELEDSVCIFQLEGMEHKVYYSSPTPLTEGFKGETAVIMIQGWGGGVKIHDEQLSLQNSFKDAYVLSPMYPRTMIIERYDVEPEGRVVWNDSWPKDLTVPGTPDDDWRGGGDANGTQLSSYDVIDTLFARLSDTRLFPNLNKIALVGFSAGGQFVGRYVAVGKGMARPGIEIEYAAMPPSTYFFPDPSEIWHYGLKGRPRYCREISDEQIMQNLRTRRCLHGCGRLDTLEKSLDKTPPAMKQGINRFVRFRNFQALVNSDSLWNSATTFHVFDSIGHSAIAAYADPFFVDYISSKK